MVEEFARDGGKKQVIRCDEMSEEERERLRKGYRRVQAGPDESGELLQQVQGEEQLGVLRGVQLLLLRQGPLAGAFER